MQTVNLTPKQTKALKLIEDGYNVFLTGSAGVGKSEIIKRFYTSNCYKRNIALTSTTGISAINIGGFTLHSWAGIMLGTADADVLLLKMYPKPKQRWREVNTLVIDEISMLDPKLLDKLDVIARNLRFSNKPFGGIQVIFTGDGLQLPPVKADDKFFFESKVWKELNLKIVHLTESMRQKDLEFQQALNEVRMFNISEKTKALLETRCKDLSVYTGDINPEIKATKLYGTNIKVQNKNDKVLKSLIEKHSVEYEYDLEYKLIDKKKDPQKYLTNVMAPAKLTLTLECQVMLIFNLEQESGLVNGSKGIIIKFVDDFPLVRFMNGLERVIVYNTWNVEENGDVILQYTQVPLILGYAFSVHKTQSLTIDKVEVNVMDFFEKGQFYTAISRVRTLEGLTLKNLNWGKVKAHPKVLEFYKSLENSENEKD